FHPSAHRTRAGGPGPLALARRLRASLGPQALPLISVSSARSSAIRPRYNQRDFEWRQRRVVAEVAVTACGAPDRHASCQDLLPDCFGPRASLFVGREGNRILGGRAVTLDTARLDDPRDVIVPRDASRDRIVRVDGYHRHDDGADECGGGDGRSSFYVDH